jgi:hypothetical protein
MVFQGRASTLRSKRLRADIEVSAERVSRRLAGVIL